MRGDRALAVAEALLDQQRQALLSGDLAALEQMPDRLTRALDALADQRLPPAMLTRLQAAAGHNARLLLAAQRGLAQTRGRASDDRAAALTTYDAAGQRMSTTPDARLLSRR